MTSETDLILTLMDQGKEIGIEPSEGTTYFYVKTKEGYKLESLIKSIDEIDIRYYWDTINPVEYDMQIEFQRIDPKEKVDQVIDWLELPISERPRLICLYFNEPDHAGHVFGPNSEEVNEQIKESDNILLDILISSLKNVVALQIPTTLTPYPTVANFTTSL